MTIQIREIEAKSRLQIRIEGTVQGVGFRPFVYRLAKKYGLAGWVKNDTCGVVLEIEGAAADLTNFLKKIKEAAPFPAWIDRLETTSFPPEGRTGFQILESDAGAGKSAEILPDIATCGDCLQELYDPKNRRYRYPFINCTHCGPRFSILEAIPYDRPNTSMKHFQMCAACQQEYADPQKRRFHAQPNACADCGPQLAFWDEVGNVLSTRDSALNNTVHALQKGQIIAVKGIGGFHLMVDASNEAAVMRLRARKHRPAKPFALLYPSLERVRQDCTLSELEAALLTSPSAPIVLLHRTVGSEVASALAPDNPYLGIMLPYAPLYHLLMRALNAPLVATSANLSNEVICIDEHEALMRLKGIAEGFLVHNRPIVRPLEDSLVRVMVGREMLLRRGRGYALFSVPLEISTPPFLALGAHLKNTVALGQGKKLMLSPHIGDLETAASLSHFDQCIQDLKCLYEVQPQHIACDAHPAYRSTQRAEAFHLPMTQVQHHHAHVAACMAEHRLRGPVLGIVWDGSGLGTDGRLWGGEFLRVTEKSFERLAHLRSFPLPGAESAIREPRRAALGLLYAIYGESLFEEMDLPLLSAFSSQELKVVKTMLQKGIQTPLTSSAGRLFDAMASLLDLKQHNSFEGEAAMALEFSITDEACHDLYSFHVRPGTPLIVDWEPMLHALLRDRAASVSTGVISKKCHNTLVALMLAMAKQSGEKQVVLSGGCFQNRYLLEQAVICLREAGFEVYWPQQIPPNDGGIALGQAFVTAHHLKDHQSCA